MTIGRLRAFAICSMGAALAVMLTACGQDNRYVAPPPPQVKVALPLQHEVTRYLEATGYTAAVNTTNLVARVQGVLQGIHYQDGDLVKEGATLFTIEPAPCQLQLEQAQAAEAGVLRVREEIRRLGITDKQLRRTPVEVALQGDTGSPYVGKLDYASPTVNQATGTLAVRALVTNANRVLLPGYFVRVRIAEEQ